LILQVRALKGNIRPKISPNHVIVYVYSVIIGQEIRVKAKNLSGLQVCKEGSYPLVEARSRVLRPKESGYG